MLLDAFFRFHFDAISPLIGAMLICLYVCFVCLCHYCLLLLFAILCRHMIYSADADLLIIIVAVISRHDFTLPPLFRYLPLCDADFVLPLPWYLASLRSLISLMICRHMMRARARVMFCALFWFAATPPPLFRLDFFIILCWCRCRRHDICATPAICCSLARLLIHLLLSILLIMLCSVTFSLTCCLYHCSLDTMLSFAIWHVYHHSAPLRYYRYLSPPWLPRDIAAHASASMFCLMPPPLMRDMPFRAFIWAALCQRHKMPPCAQLSFDASRSAAMSRYIFARRALLMFAYAARTMPRDVPCHMPRVADDAMQRLLIRVAATRHMLPYFFMPLMPPLPRFVAYYLPCCSAACLLDFAIIFAVTPMLRHYSFIDIIFHAAACLADYAFFHLILLLSVFRHVMLDIVVATGSSICFFDNADMPRAFRCLPHWLFARFRLIFAAAADDAAFFPVYYRCDYRDISCHATCRRRDDALICPLFPAASRSSTIYYADMLFRRRYRAMLPRARYDALYIRRWCLCYTYIMPDD